MRTISREGLWTSVENRRKMEIEKMVNRLFEVALWAIPAVVPAGIALLVGPAHLISEMTTALCTAPVIAWMAIGLGRQLALR